MGFLHVVENLVTWPLRRNFRIGQGFGGTKVILTGKWEKGVSSYMKLWGIHELELCYINGFISNGSFDFLLTLPAINGLKICDPSATDISAINRLVDLRYLSLDLTPISGINFANLQHLELLRMDWVLNAETLFECTNLKELALSKYPGKQGSVPFANLPHLHRLWLSCCGLEEIENFKAMTKLESLDLLNMSHLRSLHGIEELINLKKLRIESCKNIGDIEPIQNLQNLEFLSVSDCGNIASLEPLRNLTKLETLQFYESTNILDGKLDFLEQLPKLRVLQFKERKNYNRKRQDFRQAQ